MSAVLHGHSSSGGGVAVKWVLDAQQSTSNVGSTFLSIDCVVGSHSSIPPFCKHLHPVVFLLLSD